MLKKNFLKFCDGLCELNAISSDERPYLCEDWNKHYYLREMQWARYVLSIAERGESFDITGPLQLLMVGVLLPLLWYPLNC